MNAKVQEILKKQTYKFVIDNGGTEAEAIEAGEQKIRSLQKLAERETKQKWVDVTTGKKHTPQTPY